MSRRGRLPRRGSPRRALPAHMMSVYLIAGWHAVFDTFRRAGVLQLCRCPGCNGRGYCPGDVWGEDCWICDGVGEVKV